MSMLPSCSCITKLPQFPGPYHDTESSYQKFDKIEETIKNYLEQPSPIPQPTLSPIVYLVISDMINRMKEGEKKYGTKLTAFNGRSALRDAYEEAMDLTLYLKQRLEEESEDE